MNIEDIRPLPIHPSPNAGESFTLALEGIPPSKTFGRSMRNASSTQRPMFLQLRHAAIQAMAGRKWYEGPVGLDLTYAAPNPSSVLDNHYFDGVMDTLGGGHGPTFIYLPIVYLDDCQVAWISSKAQTSHVTRYSLTVTFAQP